MGRALTQVQELAAHLARTAIGLSPLFYVGVACAAAVAAYSDDFYLMEVLVLVILYAHFAASWDVLCGYAALDNFGHAFFIGGAGYMAAMLHVWLGISSWFMS